jgi:hypothetical protein
MALRVVDSAGLACTGAAGAEQVCDAAAGAGHNIIFAQAGLCVPAAAADAAVRAAMDQTQRPASASMAASMDLARARIPRNLGAHVAGLPEKGDESDEEEYELEEDDDAEDDDDGENCAELGE